MVGGREDIRRQGRLMAALAKKGVRAGWLRGRLKSLAARWGLPARLRDRYRPERHYMRGPGPKWHAAHSTASTPLGRSAGREV